MEVVCNQSNQDWLSSLVCIIYDFQTLITGVLAAAIAIWVGCLILSQLKDSNLQARISRRETMARRLSEDVLRFKKVEETLKEPLDLAHRMAIGPDGEPSTLNPESAFILDQKFHRILDWYLDDLANTEHSDIEALKVELKEELSNLSDVLQDAHWAAHNDQQDEHHNFSDQQWAEVLERHEQAKANAFQFVVDTDQAFRALKAGHDEWVRSSREKISKLDLEISARS